MVAAVGSSVAAAAVCWIACKLLALASVDTPNRLVGWYAPQFVSWARCVDLSVVQLVAHSLHMFCSKR